MFFSIFQWMVGTAAVGIYLTLNPYLHPDTPPDLIIPIQLWLSWLVLHLGAMVGLMVELFVNPRHYLWKQPRL